MRLNRRVERLESRRRDGGCTHPCHQPAQIETIEVPAGCDVVLDEQPARCPDCGGRAYAGIRQVVVIEPGALQWAS